MKITILGTDADRAEIVSFIGQKLDRVRERFKLTEADVAVWLRDTNGPRGGVDQECSIRLSRGRHAPVIVKCRDSSVRVAILGAIARLRRALAR